MGIFSQDFLIHLNDVGPNNQLTNRGCLRLMQEVAAIHSSVVGFGINDVNTTHLAWVILNWKLKVFSRPKWNTKLTINTWAHHSDKYYSYRDFEIFDENHNLIAIATSKWILINVVKQSISKIVPEMEEKYGYTDKHVFESKEFIEKLKEPLSITSVCECIVQKKDIDTNNHVNNLCYLDYALEAIQNDSYYNCNFNNIEIMYKHEAKLNETVVVYDCMESDNSHTIAIKNKETLQLHAIVKLF